MKSHFQWDRRSLLKFVLWNLNLQTKQKTLFFIFPLAHETNLKSVNSSCNSFHWINEFNDCCEIFMHSMLRNQVWNEWQRTHKAVQIAKMTTDTLTKSKMKTATWKITKNNDSHKCDLFCQFHGWAFVINFFFLWVALLKSPSLIGMCIKMRTYHQDMSCNFNWIFAKRSVVFDSVFVVGFPSFCSFSPLHTNSIVCHCDCVVFYISFVIFLFSSSKFNLTWDSYPYKWKYKYINCMVCILSGPKRLVCWTKSEWKKQKQTNTFPFLHCKWYSGKQKRKTKWNE